MKLAKLITFAITLIMSFGCMAFTASAADDGAVALNEKNFPSDILRDYLSKKADIDGDGYISSEEMPRAWVININKWDTPEYFNGESMPDIDLKGINLLTKVHDLCISGCNIKNADLSDCETLELVSLDGEHIDGLDLTGLKNLENLYLSAEGFSDFKVEDLPSLQLFSFTNSADLKSLELSNLPVLRTLLCSNNSIVKLNVEDCPLLSTVDCSSNRLTNIDLSQIPNIMTLICKDNMIGELDITGSQYLIRDLNNFDPNKGAEQGMYPLQTDKSTKIKGKELIKTQDNEAADVSEEESSTTEEDEGSRSNKPFIIFGVTVAVIVCGVIAADIILKNRKNKENK